MKSKYKRLERQLRMAKIIRRESVKVIDPVRLPNVQLPYETSAKKRYEHMLKGMTKMLTIALTTGIEK